MSNIINKFILSIAITLFCSGLNLAMEKETIQDSKNNDNLNLTNLFLNNPEEFYNTWGTFGDVSEGGQGGKLPKELSQLISSKFMATHPIIPLLSKAFSKILKNKSNKAIFNKDGAKAIIISENEKNIELIDIDTVIFLKQFKTDTYIIDVVFNDQEGKLIILDYQDDIFVLDVETNNQIHIMTTDDDDKFLSVGFNKANNKIILLTLNGFAEIWDIQTLKLIHSFFIGSANPSMYAHVGHNGKAYFNESGDKLVSWGEECKVWDLNTGQELYNFGKVSIEAAPDIKNYIKDKIAILAYKDFNSSSEKIVKVFDINSGENLITIQDDHISRVALNSTEDRLLTISGNKKGEIITKANSKFLKLWDAKTGQYLTTLGNPIEEVNFNIQGNKIIAKTCDGKIRVYDAYTYECEFILGEDKLPYKVSDKTN